MKKILSLIAALIIGGVSISVSAQTEAIYSFNGQSGSPSTLNFSDGASLVLSEGQGSIESITIANTVYSAIKVKGNTEHTLKLLKPAKNITFYSFCNSSSTKSNAFWSSVAGVTYTKTNATLMKAYKDANKSYQTNPDIISFTLDNLKDIVFKTSTQVGLVIKVEYADDAASTTESVSIHSSGYSTFAATNAVDYSKVDGLTAYAVKYNATDDKLTYTEITGVVPAKTPVLLQGEGGKEYTLEAAEGEGTTVDTDLKLADGTVKGDGSTIYALATQDNVTGFYRVTNETVLASGKGYLEITRPSTASVNSVAFYSLNGGSGDGTTGISSVQASTPANDSAIYSLSGQRVSKSYKGIVIINGKKMIQK